VEGVLEVAPPFHEERLDAFVGHVLDLVLLLPGFGYEIVPFGFRGLRSRPPVFGYQIGYEIFPGIRYSS